MPPNLLGLTEEQAEQLRQEERAKQKERAAGVATSDADASTEEDGSGEAGGAGDDDDADGDKLAEELKGLSIGDGEDGGKREQHAAAAADDEDGKETSGHRVSDDEVRRLANPPFRLLAVDVLFVAYDPSVSDMNWDG